MVKSQNNTDVIWVQYWIHDKALPRVIMDINTIGKTWLSFLKQVNSVSGVCGLAVKATASQSKGRELKSRCGQEEFFIL